jgi:nucleoside-diphosphate-sugar epimerase
VGEYGQSALARERVFEYFAHRNHTPLALLRLNYAIDVRYGVLVDLARKVKDGVPIDLTMGHFNCIWQGDANSICLRALAHCAVPPFVINVTGTETHSVRETAIALGKRLGVEPQFTGVEAADALLSNAARLRELFGPPSVSFEQMLDAVADWTARDGRLYGKPTHFEVRDGRF